VDIVSLEKRSEVMRSVRSKDTRPELIVRKVAHSLGFRFRVNVRDLPGCPDLAIKSRKKAIFVHGCFWHRHQNCRRATTPQSNHEYWSKKFAGNIERDDRTMAAYRAMGWEPFVIWECELGNRKVLADRIARYLSKADGR
jgi:DNA mismatch endonuclease, patch repair protein